MPDRGIYVVVNEDFRSVLYIQSIMYGEPDYIEQPMLHNRRLYICNNTAFTPKSVRTPLCLQRNSLDGLVQ
jgi:hypothetical protein